MKDNVKTIEKKNAHKHISTEHKKIFQWRGALKNVKETSVSLQHKVKKIW